MRRELVSTLAVPVLLLSACGGDEPEVVETPAVTEETVEEPAETTTEDAMETTEDDSMKTTEDDSMKTTEDDSMMTTEDDSMMTTGDAEETTADAGGEEDASGEEQAAADRTKEWLVAFVNGDAEVCNYMLDFTSEGPMAESEEDLGMCESMIPPMAESMFDAEMAGIIESMEVNGATIDGDTAVVGAENFSEMFAAGIGDQEITLKNVDGEWYVDLENSFQTN